jgi:hypothetical protein
MENLTEKDVEILDSILEKIVKQGSVFSLDLPPLKKEYFSKFREIKSVEYSYYLEILTKYDIAIVDKRLDGSFTVSQLETKTINFYKQGGFRTVYQKHHFTESRKLELEDLEYKKLQWDYQISKFQAKTKWWPLIISVISFILAVTALIID